MALETLTWSTIWLSKNNRFIFYIFLLQKIICSKVLFNQLFSNFLSLWIYRTVICNYTESFILIQDLLLKQQNCEKMTWKTAFSILKPPNTTQVASPKVVLRFTGMSKLCLNRFFMLVSGQTWQNGDNLNCG